MYMYRGLQRFRTSGSSIINRFTVSQLKRKASNSWSAIQDTYYSTKDIFERHKVVFTISTSIASVATAWFVKFIVWFCPRRFFITLLANSLVEDLGYTLRHVHQSRVDHRLESIEKAMKNNYQIEDPEFKKLVSGSITVPACVATAGTTLIIGYGLGWRGGKWYANRKFRREQMKLLGQIKPKRWPLRFLRRSPIKPKSPENLLTGSEALPKDTSVSHP